MNQNMKREINTNSTLSADLQPRDAQAITPKHWGGGKSLIISDIQ